MRPLRLLHLAALVLVAPLAACGAPAAAPADAPAAGQGIVAGTLEARRDGDALVLRNTTEFVVAYQLLEANTATLALLPVCLPATCPTLRQGESRRVPLVEVTGWTPAAREVMVTWWRFVPGRDGTPVAGVAETVRVRL